MDRARAEAMHGYHEACRGLVAAEIRCPAYPTAFEDERTAIAACLAEGVSAEEMGALAALAGSRFAPRWAVAAYGGGR